MILQKQTSHKPHDNIQSRRCFWREDPTMYSRCLTSADQVPTQTEVSANPLLMEMTSSDFVVSVSLKSHRRIRRLPVCETWRQHWFGSVSLVPDQDDPPSLMEQWILNDGVNTKHLNWLAAEHMWFSQRAVKEDVVDSNQILNGWQTPEHHVLFALQRVVAPHGDAAPPHFLWAQLL